MIRRFAAVAALVVVAVVPAAAPSASAAPSATHCVQHVVGQRDSGELVLSAPRCYRTFDQAMDAEHVAAWGPGASQRAAGAGLALTDFTLATHYDLTGQNPAGGTTSTVGSACTGGWLNASTAWNNRIGSTANGCPNVLHFDGYNLTGASLTTTGSGGNLGPMDNRTSSIQYA